jgi:hypothetical protein
MHEMFGASSRTVFKDHRVRSSVDDVDGDKLSGWLDLIEMHGWTAGEP